jgi:quinol monooxygenase YgiN
MRSTPMVKVGLMVRIEAQAGKAEEVEAKLNAVLAQVQREETTPLWFALRLGPTSFAVFDAFADEAGRQAHLDANLGALRAAAPTLFAGDPAVGYVDVIAAKYPASDRQG